MQMLGLQSERMIAKSNDRNAQVSLLHTNR
jgi:hypothetical protein